MRDFLCVWDSSSINYISSRSKFFIKKWIKGKFSHAWAHFLEIINYQELIYSYTHFYGDAFQWVKVIFISNLRNFPLIFQIIFNIQFNFTSRTLARSNVNPTLNQSFENLNRFFILAIVKNLSKAALKLNNILASFFSHDFSQEMFVIRLTFHSSDTAFIQTPWTEMRVQTLVSFKFPERINFIHSSRAKVI